MKGRTWDVDGHHIPSLSRETTTPFGRYMAGSQGREPFLPGFLPLSQPANLTVPRKSSPARDWSAPSTFHSAGSFRCRNAKATFSSRKSTSAAGGLDLSKNRVKFSACWLPAQVARNWAAS